MIEACIELHFGFASHFLITQSFISVEHLIVILLYIFALFLDSLRTRFLDGESIKHCFKLVSCELSTKI